MRCCGCPEKLRCENLCKCKANLSHSNDFRDMIFFLFEIYKYLFKACSIIHTKQGFVVPFQSIYKGIRPAKNYTTITFQLYLWLSSLLALGLSNEVQFVFYYYLVQKRNLINTKKLLSNFKKQLTIIEVGIAFCTTAKHHLLTTP